jgi:ubiquinone/menaquinone biosynthesis C-methylase UbiE
MNATEREYSASFPNCFAKHKYAESVLIVESQKGKRSGITMNMKEEWDSRARADAFHYVSSFSRDWNDKSFYQWGEIQTQVVIDEYFRHLNLNPSDLVMLEIGCGAGRMTRALASRFKSVFAYDVSEEYIRIAKEHNRHLKNVIFSANDGLSFPAIDDESIDFVFSGWVFQHMPTKEVVIRNIEEMARILRKGGMYKIDPALIERLSFIDPLIPKLVKSRIIRSLAPFLGIDKHVFTTTWRGARFNAREISGVLVEKGLTVNTCLEDDGFDRLRGRKAMRRWFYGERM